jgi:hypothetical protein
MRQTRSNILIKHRANSSVWTHCLRTCMEPMNLIDTLMPQSAAGCGHKRDTTKGYYKVKHLATTGECHKFSTQILPGFGAQYVQHLRWSKYFHRQNFVSMNKGKHHSKLTNKIVCPQEVRHPPDRAPCIIHSYGPCSEEKPAVRVQVSRFQNIVSNF